MSHIPLRKEKDCLNCGTIVMGRYCHVCGQENVVPKESFWHLVFHFFYDITHFDSKFFETVKDLLFKPGFLSREYMNGKRARYLHPIKMYVFTSAVFFLVFFSFFTPAISIGKGLNHELSNLDRRLEIREAQMELKRDTASYYLEKKLELLQDTSQPVTIGQLVSLAEKYDTISSGVSILGNKYNSLEEYDSIQKSLPASQRDNWFMRRFTRQTFTILKEYDKNPDAVQKKFFDDILHKLPYMLFVSLPLFAMLLKLLYLRRKQFYYADHGVFTIHLYIFSFILLAILFGLNKLENALHTGFLELVVGILFIGLYFYLYKAMRSFYGQRRAKTVIKFLLISLMSMIMMVILFIIFFFFSALTF